MPFPNGAMPFPFPPGMFPPGRCASIELGRDLDCDRDLDSDLTFDLDCDRDRRRGADGGHAHAPRWGDEEDHGGPGDEAGTLA